MVLLPSLSRAGAWRGDRVAPTEPSVSDLPRAEKITQSVYSIVSQYIGLLCIVYLYYTQRVLST